MRGLATPVSRSSHARSRRACQARPFHTRRSSGRPGSGRCASARRYALLEGCSRATASDGRPGDEMAAGGRGHVRASHTDRERAVETLKAAFVQGRLTKDELEARTGRALNARTYADLAALTADLNTAPIAAQPIAAQPVAAQPPRPDNSGIARG